MKRNKSNRILYIGNVGIEGTALYIRAQNIAKLFYKIGYHTTFICAGTKDLRRTKSDNEKYDYLYTKKYIHIPKLSGMEWLLDELTGWKYIKLLDQQIKIEVPKLVILYEYSGESRLIKYCRKNKIPLLVERVDWFEKSDWSDFTHKYILQKQADKCTWNTDKRVDGIIAISQYLANHYMQMNQKVLYIPPIFEFDRYRKITRTEQNGKLRLVYAGSIGGKKDQILPVLYALKKINTEQIHIVLDIVGLTYEQIEAATAENNWKKYGIRAFGRLKNAEAKKIIEKADFSLLLRQNKRYAKAGFSTKFAESMCLGVPVICTQVGGADGIITDMKDGVLLKNNEIETIIQKLEQLLKTDSKELLQMKKNAYDTACEIFLIDNYTEKLKSFMENLEK